MKTTLLVLPISLLPSITAQWWIRILVPDDWKDETIVWGKNTAEGVSVEQSRAKNDPESGSLCPPLGDCNITYAGITWLQFSKPTVDPRPINITMGGELLQCEITTPPNSDPGGQYTGGMKWYVDWGWGDWDGFKDGFEDGRITCRRGPDGEEQ